MVGWNAGGVVSGARGLLVARASVVSVVDGRSTLRFRRFDCDQRKQIAQFACNEERGVKGVSSLRSV